MIVREVKIFILMKLNRPFNSSQIVDLSIVGYPDEELGENRVPFYS